MLVCRRFPDRNVIARWGSTQKCRIDVTWQRRTSRLLGFPWIPMVSPSDWEQLRVSDPISIASDTSCDSWSVRTCVAIDTEATAFRGEQRTLDSLQLQTEPRSRRWATPFLSFSQIQSFSCWVWWFFNVQRDTFLGNWRHGWWYRPCGVCWCQSFSAKAEILRVRGKSGVSVTPMW